METTLDLSRWREKPHGLTYRRWVIVSTGLRQLLRTRFFQILLVIAWTAAVVMAAAGFLFTQSVASGGWFESAAANFGPRAQAIVSAFCSLVLLYPDICIRGLFTLIFWLQSYVGLGLSLLALCSIVPRLITQDRASNALTIYLSRPLTSSDYLLGKLGIIAGAIALMWTGPMLFGWVLSMAFAPDSDFFVYSFSPLMRAGLFNLIGLVVLATIALGVSSLGRSARSTVSIWMGVWIIAGVVAGMPATPDFIRHASFGYDLEQTRRAVFQLDKALIDAGSTLPFINRDISRNLTRAGEKTRPANANGSLGGLAVLVTLSSVVFLRKLRPE